MRKFLLILTISTTILFAQIDSVRFFAYQIQMLDEPGAIDSIVESRYDMVILEPTRTERGMEDFDARGMVATIESSPGSYLENKITLAYIDIGEAEDWRYYWEPWWVPPTETEPGIPDFMVTADPDGWEGNYPVAYWDIRWQNIMVNDDSSMLRRIIADGFDGIYIDWVEAYDETSVLARADSLGIDAESEMINFIRSIRDTAQLLDPDFILVAQNGADLKDGHPEYFDIIDGIAQEDLSFYGEADVDWGDPLGGDIPQDSEYQTYLLGLLDDYLAHDIPVFTVDYCLIPANIDSAYNFAISHGYIPFVSQTSLSRLPNYYPPGYTQIYESIRFPNRQKIFAHPNPFNSTVRISVPGDNFDNPAIEIYDLFGKIIARLSIKNNSMELTWHPDNNVGSGLYLIKTPSSPTFQGKIIYLK